jgi:hypothetical protein
MKIMTYTNNYRHLYNENDIDILAKDKDIFDCNHWDDDGPDLFIQVSDEREVTCYFLDFVRENVHRTIQQGHSGYILCVPEIFHLFLSDYLNDEGVKAVEGCISYLIRNGGLPLVCVSSRNDTYQRFMQI